MRIRGLIMWLLLVLSAAGCRQTTIIPESAIVAAENDKVVVLLNREDTNEVPQVALWIRHKENGEENRLLLTHPHSRRDWQTYEESVAIPADSIATVSRVTIISDVDQPLKLLVEGCPDFRNVESFIVTEGSDEAIWLPTSAGLLGITQEEYLLIMESYDYYEGGGRYSRIDAFDRDGKRINSMPVKLPQQHNATRHR